MLPLILGGIALTAVGYGVKEYCESEGCPWDDHATYTPTFYNVFEEITKSRRLLHEEVLPACREVLLKVEHTQEKFRLEVLPPLEEVLEGVDDSEELQLYAQKLQSQLAEATELLVLHSHAVEALLGSGVVFDAFEKPQKKLVKRAFKLYRATQKLLALPLLDDGGVLNVEIIVPLRKYGVLIEGCRGNMQ
jgi:hypothetical protein